MAEIEDFAKIDIRFGRIIKVPEFPQAKKSAYRLKTDFGPGVEIMKSCAQLTAN